VSRNVLIFDIRNNEEAEGDKRMIGSDRLDETADEGDFGIPDAGRLARCDVFAD
jgi:hypothetical protein